MANQRAGTEPWGGKSLLEEDRRWTCVEISRELSIAASTVHTILRKSWTWGKFVPTGFLTLWLKLESGSEWRQQKMHLELYEYEGEAFLRRVITMDETWICSYTHELKRQSNEWRHIESPRTKRCRALQDPSKLMIIARFDYEGIILVQYRTSWLGSLKFLE